MCKFCEVLYNYKIIYRENLPDHYALQKGGKEEVCLSCPKSMPACLCQRVINYCMHPIMITRALPPVRKRERQNNRSKKGSYLSVAHAMIRVSRTEEQARSI